MTYARKMARKPFNGIRAVPIGPGTVEAVIREVIEQCAKEADDYNDEVAFRIRCLAIQPLSPRDEPEDPA